MQFVYHYIDLLGRKKKGLIEAQTLDEAKERLRSQNLLITSLEALNGKKRGHTHLKKTALITFTTQLASLLQAGMPLYESLLSLEEQVRGEGYHATLLTLSEKIKAGASLSEAMSAFPKSFDRLYCSLVAAGEAVGRLGPTLEKLAIHLSRQQKIKKQLLTALIYPAVLCGFSVVVIFALLTFVIPSLEVLFEDRPMNGFTRIVIGMSHLITRLWWLYLPLIGGGVTALYYWLKTEQRLDKLLLKVPVVKTVITQSVIARFTRTLGTLLEGGVSLIEALRSARGVMRHPLFEKVIERAEQKIVEGSLLSLELKKSLLIPTLVYRMLAIGEEGGNTPDMLNKIATLYEEELEKTLTRLTTLAQPVILLIMGAIVGGIMLAVLLPLTDVSAFL